ncbi:MAG: hypothetical protein V4689_08020 [Verrucomicrobiota bacterium]
MPSEQRKPLWLIPNLLSLDAPLVAVAWLYMFAKTWRVDYLPWAAYFSLGLVVWVIYVTDRLLDATLDGGDSLKLEARHEFHRRHQRAFLRGVIAAAVVAIILVVTRLPFAIYGIVLGSNGYIGYAIIGGLMVAGFFILSVFTDKGPNEIPHGKNILAGLSFAYGTSMIAYAYTSFDFWDFMGSRQLVCFAVLCILNISAIDLWEHANRSSDPEIKATDELALTLPLILLGAAALVFAAQDHELTTRPFYYAILTGAALLHILNRNRARFRMDALRVLADVALLVPFVVFLASAKS